MAHLSAIRVQKNHKPAEVQAKWSASRGGIIRFRVGAWVLSAPGHPLTEIPSTLNPKPYVILYL